MHYLETASFPSDAVSPPLKSPLYLTQLLPPNFGLPYVLSLQQEALLVPRAPLPRAVPCGRQGGGRVCSREMRCWALSHGAAVLYGELGFSRLLQHGQRMGTL